MFSFHMMRNALHKWERKKVSKISELFLFNISDQQVVRPQRKDLKIEYISSYDLLDTETHYCVRSWSNN